MSYSLAENAWEGTIYRDNMPIGDLDFDAPGDGHPFISWLDAGNFTAADLRELADWLDQQPLPEHLQEFVK